MRSSCSSESRTVKKSSTLKRFGISDRMISFPPHSLKAQGQYNPAGDAGSRRLRNDLGACPSVCHRNRKPGTAAEERVFGRREPDPPSENPRPVVVIRRGKSNSGGDCSPARTKGPRRFVGGRETGNAAELVPKTHRQQVRWVEKSQIMGPSTDGPGNGATGDTDGEGQPGVGL